MKKLPLLSLLTVVCLYSTATFARICFLGDTKCQSGKFAVDVNEPCRNQNSAWIYESDVCEGLVYGSPVCNDDTGNYYDEGQCPSGYTDVASLDSKYECATSLLCNKCCKNEDVRCTSEYKTCSNNSQGVDSGGNSVCQEPGGDIKYRECECVTFIYFLLNCLSL